MALTDGERVITWGGGSYGQLGNGFGFDSEQPQILSGLYCIVQVGDCPPGSFSARGLMPHTI